MAILLIAVGAFWALMGAVDIVGMKGWGDHSATGLLVFGLIFNGVLFVIPGLILCGIGAGLRRRRGSTVRMQPARVIDAADPKRRACPYCAELILPAARVCRFCSRELPRGWADDVLDLTEAIGKDGTVRRIQPLQGRK